MPAEKVGPSQRLLFSAIGLLAGDAALLIFLLLPRVQLGPRHLALPWDVLVLYAIFSIIGWALVGVPVTLAFPAPVLSRTPWPICLLIGAALGPLALLLILLVLGALQGALFTFSLDHTAALWPLSILISSVAFLTYAALLARRLR